MKSKFLFIIIVLLLAGCSGAQMRDVPYSYIGIQAALIANEDKIELIGIPSHGAIGDSLAISAKGGGNATALRKNLISLSKKGGGVIVVTSRNAALSRAVVEGALGAGNYSYNDITLIFAGDPINSNALKPIVESAGIKYGFVDISKPM